MNKNFAIVERVTQVILNKEKTSIEKCFINNEYKKDRNIVYFYPFLYAKKHMEFY